MRYPVISRTFHPNKIRSQGVFPLVQAVLASCTHFEDCDAACNGQTSLLNRGRVPLGDSRLELFQDQLMDKAKQVRAKVQ